MVPIQLNSIATKPVNATVVANKQQPAISKNQIAIIARPVLTSSATTSHPTIIQPTITKIQTVDKQSTAAATKASTVNVSQLSTDHNYFSRSSSVKTINNANNVITIPASSIPLTLTSGQKIYVNRTATNNATTASFIPIASNNLVNSNNKTVNKIITITTNPTANTSTQMPVTKNIIIKSPVKSPVKKTTTVEKATTPTSDKKRKTESNDELVKMGAEALFNLANGTVKPAKTSDKFKETAKQTEGNNKNEKTPTKTRTITIHHTVSTAASSTSTTTLTRSAAKKLKTTS